MKSTFRALLQSQHANILRDIKRIIQQSNDKNIIVIVNK
jgi:phage regulator Rha-like protein